MNADVRDVLMRRGMLNYPLDESGLPIAWWVDRQTFVDHSGRTHVREITCNSISGSFARYEVLLKRKFLAAFDPQI